MLDFVHVELEVSLSHLNRGVTLAAEYTIVETTLAFRLKQIHTQNSWNEVIRK